MPLNESVIGTKHILYTKEPHSRFKIVQTPKSNLRTKFVIRQEEFDGLFIKYM